MVADIVLMVVDIVMVVVDIVMVVVDIVLMQVVDITQFLLNYLMQIRFCFGFDVKNSCLLGWDW